MTTLLRFHTSRLAMAALAAATLTAGFALHASASHAASPWTVTISAAAATYPAGSDATFLVHVDGVGAQLPSLDYVAEGGTVDTAEPLHSVSSTAAEAQVSVSRDSGGSASLSATFGGQTLATGHATFAAMGAVTVNVTLDAGVDAAARTWRFQLADASGNVVSTLDASTSGDALTGTATTALLPYGTYAVKQLLGNDTALACANNAFYAVMSPTGASTTVTLSNASAAAAFTIKPCDAPKQSVSIPVDPIAFPTATAAPTFTTAPGDAPINEVRGVRQEGPGAAASPSGGRAPAATVLPPNTGSGAVSGSNESAELFELLGLALAAVAPIGAGYGLRRRERSRVHTH